MNTTLELPDELMREVRIRAAMEGRKLKDVVEQALGTGLAPTSRSSTPREGLRVEMDPQTGPTVAIAVTDALGSAMTPQDLRRLEQDAGYREDLRGAGLSL